MAKLDPRQHRSKESMYDAYLDLLADNEAIISVRQLCTKAGITRPTFYKQYSDLEALRLDIHNNLLSKLKKALTINNPIPMADYEASNDLPENMVLLFKHIYQHRYAYEILLVDHPDALFINDVKSIIRQFIIEGIRYSKAQDRLVQVDRDFLISYITGAYTETILWWIKNNYSMTAEKVAESLFKMALKGPSTS